MDHVVSLSGLKSGKRYSYRILDDSGAVSYQSQFSTCPRRNSSRAIRFAVLGDSGTGDANQYAVSSAVERTNPLLLLHTGDVIYPAGELSDYQDKFFIPYAQILDSVAIFPSVGNHDAFHLDAYTSVFDLPQRRSLSNSEEYYSFDCGRVHFIALSTERDFSPASAQYQWLQHDLSYISPDITWRVIFFHKPPYSEGPHGSNTDVRTYLVPIFERYNVDVVFSGHDHAYERSKAITHTSSNGRGVVYIVTGGGGGSLYPQAADIEEIVQYQSVYHFLQVDANRRSLTATAISTENVALDRVTLTK